MNFTELTTKQLVEWIKANKNSSFLNEAIEKRVSRDKSTSTYSIKEFENKLNKKLT